jgi:hypothetical protein
MNRENELKHGHDRDTNIDTAKDTDIDTDNDTDENGTVAELHVPRHHSYELWHTVLDG